MNEQSDTVYAVTRAITRYGITTDAPNKWRYFLDSVEVHLPPFWEQHINDENSVELIPTDSLPLNEQSDTVYAVTRAITRYGITTDAPNKWRYFL
ncbi:IgaA/UmoB family intracellular growth attenuator, partial [Enterobacter hormaechei]|uniref:IgaA/UmoB family intracellular growth attenuator n=1 Tax=Enterobacter hormaechei TaxID=158836 RepID=UPI003CC6ECBD